MRLRRGTRPADVAALTGRPPVGRIPLRAGDPAFAAGDNMVVNANVANACTFNASDVTVDMTSIRTGVTQSGNVQIWCTNGYAVQVSATSANAYNLVSGANTIAYTFTSGGSAFTNLPFTGGSRLMLAFLILARPAGDSASPLMSLTILDRSRILPLPSMMPGFSLPAAP